MRKAIRLIGFDTRITVGVLMLQAALASGSKGEHADMVIQSTHKMLSALTQASMLHIKGQRAAVLSDRTSRILQVLQVSASLGRHHANVMASSCPHLVCSGLPAVNFC